MIRAILYLLSAMAIVGCSCTEVYTNCPSVPKYDKTFQDRLANEITPLPSDSALVQFSLDYVRLREALKQCASEG